ncbi:DNA-binding CsgD family transcriptional regulator/lambda repressor-like predicted transcriptional regulator [Streptacidiphilus sp. MAP12-20]|uniref:response regulator transcription factor n=1 Tax=Streptacidiphilus sp. MAP12-20 TaxID=3156299 RepID=UPI0035134564
MSAPAPTPSFSPREIEVLEHLLKGVTYGTIARRLQLSPHTVDTYLRRIRAKTGSANRTQLALLAVALRPHSPADLPRAAGAAPAPPVPSAHLGRIPGDGQPEALAPGRGIRVGRSTAGASTLALRHVPQPVHPGIPDPAAATTPAEFVTQLRLLKAWSGEPSLRQLERRTGLPRSTLAETLDPRHNRLPPLERVVAIVRACGAPASVAQHWADNWRKVRMLHCLPPGAFPARSAGRGEAASEVGA